MYEYELLRYRYADYLMKETMRSKDKHAFRRRATLPRAGRAGGEREPSLREPPNHQYLTFHDGSAARLPAQPALRRSLVPQPVLSPMAISLASTDSPAPTSVRAAPAASAGLAPRQIGFAMARARSAALPPRRRRRHTTGGGFYTRLDRLLRGRNVVALPCAAPPMAYLQVPLLLQAALGAWFFGSTESVGAGAAVGVLALLGAVAIRDSVRIEQ